MKIISDLFSVNALIVGLCITLALFSTLLNTYNSTVSGQLDNASNNTEIFLSSWNQGNAKEQIMNFLNNITNPENSKYYVLPEDRIAVFDND